MWLQYLFKYSDHTKFWRGHVLSFVDLTPMEHIFLQCKAAKSQLFFPLENLNVDTIISNFTQTVKFLHGKRILEDSCSAVRYLRTYLTDKSRVNFLLSWEMFVPQACSSTPPLIT